MLTLLWLGFQRTDPRLKWDPALWNGTAQLVVPLSLIWAPDIVVYETVAVSDVSSPPGFDVASVCVRLRLRLRVRERALLFVFACVLAWTCTDRTIASMQNHTTFTPHPSPHQP